MGRLRPPIGPVSEAFRSSRPTTRGANMSEVSRNTRRGLLAVAAVLVVAGALGVAAWKLAGPGARRAGPSANAIMVVAPYWYNGTWVFDDAAVGLRREPFVAGVPEMIDVLVEDIPDAREGF